MADELHTADPQLDSLLRHVAGASVSEPAVPVTPPLPAGARLGPFVLLEVAGQGGMGVVYRARDERLQREVAVKVLPAGAEGDGQSRLIAEARAAAAVSHPNIASVYEAGVADGRAYFVMELVRGTSLQQLIDSGEGTAGQRLEWAAAVARALAHLHGQGWLHLDVKPSNVMLGADGTIKLLDLGVARPTTADARAPADGVVRGTVGYMAPEQARGEALDARADVYSFGVLLEALLGPNRRARAIVERCLEPDPARRFASGAELGAALSRLVEGRPLVTRQRVLVAAVIAALFCAGFARLHRTPELVGAGPTRRLTGHRLDAPISAAASSSDGTRFAYVDDDGLVVADRAQPQAVRRVKLDRLPTYVARLGRDWSVITHGPAEGVSTLWRVDGVGKPTVLYEGRFGFASASPDGTSIALTDRHQLVVRRLSSGEELFSWPGDETDHFCGAMWSPDGKLLAAAWTRGVAHGIERRLTVWDVAAGKLGFELESARLQQPYAPVVWGWAADGALLYALTERPGEGSGAAVWSVRLDAHGVGAEPPARLAPLDGQFLASVDLSSDGQLLTLRHDVHARAMSAELNDGALGAVTTLTDDEFDERGTHWASPDTLWHVAMRELVPTLSLRTLGKGTTPVAARGWAQTHPTVTSEPGELLYWAAVGDPYEEAPEWHLFVSKSDQTVELQIPTRPRDALAAAAMAPTSAQVRCAAKARVCLLATVDYGHVILWRLSFEGHSAARLFHLPETNPYFRAWQVSDDGERVYVVLPDASLATYGLDGTLLGQRKVRSLSYARSLAVAADDRFYLAGLTDEGEQRLVYLSPDGERVVRAHPAAIYSDLSLSPDGRRLAFVEQTFDTDVWVTPISR